MFVLATFLVLSGRNSASRAFAVFLILFGADTILEAAYVHLPQAEGRAALFTAITYLLVAILPLAWLVSTWPRPRGPLARIPHAPWVLSAMGIPLVLPPCARKRTSRSMRPLVLAFTFYPIWRGVVAIWVWLLEWPRPASVSRTFAKVRFALSRSTIAAVFIAVFFVASDPDAWSLPPHTIGS